MLRASEVQEHDFSIGKQSYSVHGFFRQEKVGHISRRGAPEAQQMHSVAHNCKSKAKVQKPSQTSKQAIAKAL